MKMKNKILVSAILSIVLSANSFAQSGQTATATATLITPISIAVANDMQFGSIAASGTSGTVTLDTATNSRSASGGVYLQSGGAAAQIAEFTVTGEANHSFTISSPATIALARSGGGSLNLALTGTATPSTLDDLGSSTIKIGGTLTVPANSLSGTYTNTTDLTVTVNYN
jgi:hypothetical protein